MANSKTDKAVRLGMEVLALEQDYDAELEKVRKDKKTDRYALYELGDKLFAKRQEGRVAEQEAGIRTEGTSPKVEDGVS